MGLFSRLSFNTWHEKDVVQNNFLDDVSNHLLNEFDAEYRFKEINNLRYPNREIKTNLLYAATEMWTRVLNASNALYKKIQILEADYSEVKSKLDNKLNYELHHMEQQRDEIIAEIEDVNQELQDYQKEKKAIEKEYHKIGDEKILKGSLNRISGWIFLLVMLIAGGAELLIYKNVFMSQEIGLVADMPSEEKFWYDIMAMTMATGFTVMLIWLAHKLGELLRHVEGTTQKEKSGYYWKFSLISLVVIAAIIATVYIRSDMHEILAKDQKVEQLNEKAEQEGSIFADDTEDDFGSTEGFSNDSDDFSDDFAEESKPTKTSTLSNEERVELLRNEITKEKGESAWLFTIINIFIVVGGLFLSYETHTSSTIYETIEKHIRKLEKRKRKFEKELAEIEAKIMHFKYKKIDPLFKELLLKAALYDKEVRSYNAYLQIFELKMQLIETYIKKIYEEKNIVFDESINYKELLQEKIVLDRRRELHHVNNIEEYMIYKYKKDANV